MQQQQGGRTKLRSASANATQLLKAAIDDATLGRSRRSAEGGPPTPPAAHFRSIRSRRDDPSACGNGLRQSAPAAVSRVHIRCALAAPSLPPLHPVGPAGPARAASPPRSVAPEEAGVCLPCLSLLLEAGILFVVRSMRCGALFFRPGGPALVGADGRFAGAAAATSFVVVRLHRFAMITCCSYFMPFRLVLLSPARSHARSGFPFARCSLGSLAALALEDLQLVGVHRQLSHLVRSRSRLRCRPTRGVGPAAGGVEPH
jgi:hypothetical protein